MLMTADQDTVFGQLTEHLKNGKSIRCLGDTIQIGAGELILRNTVPRTFTDGQHPFDYCNTGKLLDAHQQQSVSAAHPVYDGEFRQRFGARNKWNKSVIESEFAGFDFANRDPTRC